MFPGGTATDAPLDRCMRVLPHHGDTGGFFVAVLHKTGPIAPAASSRCASHPSPHRRAASIAVWIVSLSLLARTKPSGTSRRIALRLRRLSPGPARHHCRRPEPEPAANAAPLTADAQPAADEDPAAAAAAIERALPVPSALPIAADGEAAVPVQPSDAAAAAPASTDGPSASADTVTPDTSAAAAVAPAASGGWGTRGGGSRGREGSGRWGGLDPVVPVTSPDLLSSVAAFYGCGNFQPSFSLLKDAGRDLMTVRVLALSRRCSQ